MDEFTPTASAKVLFKDKKNNTKVVGVRNSAADSSWHTVWLAFDYLSTDFRSDTSKTLATDKKYAWILDVKNPATKFAKTTTGVSQQPEALVPGQFSLAQNYPNPFNPSTAINYTIGANAHVTLKVFNVLGQEVATLVNESMNPGSYSATFSASNFSSGVYFYTLTAGSFIQTNKMVLLK
jgi:hypothetical protein